MTTSIRKTTRTEQRSKAQTSAENVGREEVTEQVLRTFVDTARTAEVHLVGAVVDVLAHAAAPLPVPAGPAGAPPIDIPSA